MKLLSNILLLLLLLPASSYSQTENSDSGKIKMNYVKSLDEAIKKSKKTKKSIFVNCYADWALPCQGMEQYVFSNSDFANWMNQNFVNLWLDVVKSDEGRKFAENYSIESFAQYVVIDSNGELIYRIVGGRGLPEFKNIVERSLNENRSLRGMNRSFKKGDKNNDLNFIREYLITLHSANETEKYDTILKRYMNIIPPKDIYKKENWEIMGRQMNDLDGKMFLKLENNKDKFLENISLEAVNSRLSATYANELFSLSTGRTPFDSTKVNRLLTRINKVKLPKNDVNYLFYNIAKLRADKNYKDLISLLQSNSDSLDYRYMERIDFSLSTIDDLNDRDKKTIENYIKERQQKYPNSSAYKKAIKNFDKNNGIEFSISSFDKALIRAKNEDKLIFIDAYTSWCGPCKMMSNEIFVQKEVGELFNKKFINLKIDMEKGEGVALAKKYSVKVYPTYLLINSDGKLVHRAIGAMDKDAFISTILRGTSPKTSYKDVKLKYPILKSDRKFMVDYCLTLAAAGESIYSNDNTNIRFSVSDANSVLSKLSVAERTEPSAWKLFNEYVPADINNAIVSDFINNIDLYRKKIDSKIVDKKINEIFYPIFVNELDKPNSPKYWTNLKQYVDKMNRNSEIATIYEILTLHRAQKYSDIVTIYQNKVSKITNAKNKAYIDSLLYHIVEKSDNENKKTALDYIKTAKQSAPQNLTNIYENIENQFAK